jgi:hypothetical protein
VKEVAAVRPSASAARVLKTDRLLPHHNLFWIISSTGHFRVLSGVLLSEFRDIVCGDPITLAWPAVLSV